MPDDPLGRNDALHRIARYPSTDRSPDPLVLSTLVHWVGMTHYDHAVSQRLAQEDHSCNCIGTEPGV
jgi:hypothetical protein